MTTLQGPTQSTLALVNGGHGVGRSSLSLPSFEKQNCHEVHDTLRNQIEYYTICFQYPAAPIAPAVICRP